MNIVDIANKRYTTKHYDKTQKIPAQQVDQLLSVLKNSPSSVNSQPWHFIVLDNDATKSTILPAVMEFNHPRITDSSHTIIFCVKTDLDDEYLQNLLDQEDKDGRFPTQELKEAQHNGRQFFINKHRNTSDSLIAWESKQLYIALGQLLFAAATIDIDSTAIEGYDNIKLDEILDLKEQGLTSVVIVTLGYRDINDSNAKRPKSRLPDEQIFTFL